MRIRGEWKKKKRVENESERRLDNEKRGDENRRQ